MTVVTSVVLPGHNSVQNRMPLAIEQHADHHLLQVGPVLARMAMPAQRVAPGAVEIWRRCVEAHQIQATEEVPPPGKQGFFHQVFRRPGGKRRGGRLLGRRQRFPQPRHSAIKLMEREAVRAGNCVVVAPAVGRALEARASSAATFDERNVATSARMAPLRATSVAMAEAGNDGGMATMGNRNFSRRVSWR